MTLCEALKNGVLKLKNAGIEEYENDAWLLLSFAAGVSRAYYYAHSENVLPEEQCLAYLQYIDRRASRVPLQHITHQAYFMGYEFYVDESVLIPRQDTEVLVEECLKAMKGVPSPRILDMCTGSGCMNRRYMTKPLEKAVTMQGTVRIDLTAALAGGNAETGFDAENVNSADKLSFALGSASGRQDDLKLTVLLCDLSDDPFDAIKTTDPERNIVPEKLVAKGGIPLGEGLDDLDLRKFDTRYETWNVITRAYIDLCNPESGYAPETSAASVTLREGEAHDYHVYLNPARYTVAEGHRIAVIIGTEDPVNCLIHKVYEVAIDDASVSACIPVTDDAEPVSLYCAE